MNRLRKELPHYLMASSCCIMMTIGGATTALAQSAGPTPAGTPPAPPAADGSSGANTDGEILVTAQKRTENIQRVPLSVLVLGGATLKEKGLASINDFTAVVPTLSIRSTASNVAGTITIRGIGTQALGEPAVEQSVSVVLDGVVVGAFAGSLFNFTDLERVEVLRGPQGTLFGKGASNGVLNVVSALPTDRLTASVGASYGSLNEVKLHGTVSGPIAKDIDVRLSAYRNTRDGLGTAILPDGSHIQVDNVDEYGIRAQILAKPTSNLTARLSADYEHSHDKCCVGFVTVQNGPLVNGVFTPGTVLPEDNRVDYGNEDADVTETIKGFGVTGQFDYDLGRGYTLTSISGFRGVDFNSNTPSDHSPLPIFTRYESDYKFRQYSQELRLASPADQFIAFTAGLFYYRSTLDLYRDIRLNVFPTVYRVNTTNRIDVENYAAFGQATINVSDRFRLIAGARETSDRQTLQFRNILPASLLVPNPLAAFLPPPFNADPIAPRQFQANDLDTGFRNYNFSYKLGAQFDIADNINAFGTYSRGFKSGGFDTDATTLVNPASAIVRPEIPKGYELGLRSQFFDRHLTFNLTYFDYIFDGFQSTSYNATTAAFLIVNSKARSQGVELEFDARPTRTTTFSFNGAYTHARFGQGAADQCYNGQTLAQGCGVNGLQDLKGKSLPDAPDWAFTSDLRQEFPIGRGDSHFYSDILYYWRSGAFQTTTRAPVVYQPTYGRLDLTLGYIFDLRQGHLNVRGYIRNVAKANYSSSRVEAPVLGYYAAQFVTYEAGRRVFGIAADYAF